MAGKEANLHACIVRYLKKLRTTGHPIWFLKTHGGGRTRRGNPDLDIVFYGYAVRVELKAPGEVATKIQEQRIKEIASAGGIAGVASSLTDLKQFLHAAILRRQANGQAIFEELP